MAQLVGPVSTMPVSIHGHNLMRMMLVVVLVVMLLVMMLVIMLAWTVTMSGIKGRQELGHRWPNQECLTNHKGYRRWRQSRGRIGMSLPLLRRLGLSGSLRQKWRRWRWQAEWLPTHDHLRGWGQSRLSGWTPGSPSPPLVPPLLSLPGVSTHKLSTESATICGCVPHASASSAWSRRPDPGESCSPTPARTAALSHPIARSAGPPGWGRRIGHALDDQKLLHQRKTVASSWTGGCSPCAQTCHRGRLLVHLNAFLNHSVAAVD